MGIICDLSNFLVDLALAKMFGFFSLIGIITHLIPVSTSERQKPWEMESAKNPWTPLFQGGAGHGIPFSERPSDFL